MWYVSNFFQLECLQAQNRFRAIPGHPPLQLNKHLTDFNSININWAKKLGEFNSQEDHSNVKSYGANSIFTPESMHINDASPTRFCYRKERKNYNWQEWQEPKYSESNSSVTQIVWKESSHLGVGGSMGGDVSILVTQYSPLPNNVQGKFERNLPARIFEETLQHRCARLMQQQKIRQQQQQQQQQQRQFCQKLRECQKRLRVLEQQRLQDLQEKEQEREKYKQRPEPTSSLDVLAKTLGFNPQLGCMGIALIIVTTLAAYGAYSCMS